MAENLDPIAPVVVVTVPFLEQSHLNQLLQLSTVISSSSYNLPVHYVSSATHLCQAKLRFSNPNLLSQIQFHDLPLPPFPILPPNRGGDASDFPSHLIPMIESTLALRHPFAAFLQTLRSRAKKIVIIHDTNMSYVVQDGASLPNVELYAYNATSAFFFSSFMQEQEAGKFTVPEKIEIPNDLPSFDGCVDEDIMKFVAIQNECMKLRAGDLQNTSRVIEGDYIDLLSAMNENTRRWAIGPLNELGRFEEERRSEMGGGDECLEWLDRQPPDSVLYVCFGTTSSLPEEQVKELAIGLEESKVRFIWVLRDADKGNGSSGSSRELPEEYEERIKGVGMVVRKWAPQPEILNHPSTGGFMSHCGWTSCLESISAGVPIAAWPMHSDQPINAAFMTGVLKIGVVVREWSRRKEVVTASVVKETVKTLMASEEGEMMRKRAEELGRAAREATLEGGVSRQEMDSFIHHITNT